MTIEIPIVKKVKLKIVKPKQLEFTNMEYENELPGTNMTDNSLAAIAGKPILRQNCLCAPKEDWDAWKRFTAHSQEVQEGTVEVIPDHTMCLKAGMLVPRVRMPESYVFLGEIPNMPGHGLFYKDGATKIIIGRHLEDFRELTEDEV